MKERVFALDELGDGDAPIGTRPWCLWVSNEIRKTLYDAQQSGTRLRNLVDSFREQAGWQPLGFLTWEQFCAEKLQKEADEIETEAKLRAHGGDRKSEGYINQLDNYQVDLSKEGGTSAKYLKARIARDYPDEVKEIGKGKKYRTVHAAAVGLGIKKDDKRYQLPADAAAAGRYMANRVNKDWMLEFYDAYTKAIGE